MQLVTMRGEHFTGLECDRDTREITNLLVRARQGIEQGALSRVGIADQGNGDGVVTHR